MIDSGMTLQLLMLDENDSVRIKWNQQNLTDSEDIKFVSWDSLTDQFDLVIVNPNVKLTDGWLTTLKQCAYSYINIGTVSPVVNFELAQENEQLYKKYCSENFRNWEYVIESCAPEIYPEVNNNIFDCIYIKAELLREIGVPDRILLSDKSKAKNWFLAASQMGWHHKMAPCLLVGEKLIFDSKSKFYISRLTPPAKEMIKLFWQNIKLYFNLHFDNGRTNILHYLLADFQEGRKNNVGGTQFHVSDLVEYQKKKYNVFVLARDGEYLRLTEYVDNDKVQFDFWVGDASENIEFFDKTHEDLYRKILHTFKIGLVHIHHTLWMPLNIFYVAKEYELPIILSIHDFYYGCPVLKMIDLDGNLCDRDACNDKCSSCLSERKGILYCNQYIEKWRREHGKVMDLCSKVIFPSREAMNVMTEFYPRIQKKSCVIEHGIILPKGSEDCVFKHNKLRVAFIGGISDVKGGPVIYDLITKDKNNFDWYIMGGIGYDPLYDLRQKNLVKTGWYKRYEIYDLLKENEIDIVCILSTVSETFCYTLSEAVAVGIPVVATKVGALGERVERMKSGWLVPREADSDEIYSLLCNIKAKPEELLVIKENLKSIERKDIEEMGREYDAIYFLNENSRSGKGNLSDMLGYLYVEKEADVELEDVCQLNESIDSKEKMRLLLAERELHDLKASLIVQIALKIRKIKFPGREKLWLIVNRIIKSRKK